MTYREWWFNLFSDEPHTMKRIEIFPQVEWLTEDYYINYLNNEDTKILEIALSKKIYFLIFKECHDILNLVISSTSERSKISDLDLLKVTWGLLLTSPENKTNINLQYNILMNNLDYIDIEFNYLEALLTCNIAKINKSSSLWNLYKSLYILRSKDPIYLLDIVIRSNENHPRNYYAWNFMRWVIQLNYLFSNDVFIDEIFDLFYEKLYKYCLKNLNDSSVWNVLQQLIFPTHLEQSFFEYNNFSAMTNKKITNNGKTEIRRLSNAKIYEVLIKTSEFIQKNRIVYSCPYEFLKNISIQTSNTKMLDQLRDKNSTALVFKNGKFTGCGNSSSSEPAPMSISDTVCYDEVETLYVQQNNCRIRTLYETFYRS